MDEFVEHLSRDIIFIEEVSAVNKEIGLIVNCVFYYGQKVFKDGIGAAFAALRVTLRTLRYLKPEMGISRVDELQWDLLKLVKNLLFQRFLLRMKKYFNSLDPAIP